MVEEELVDGALVPAGAPAAGRRARSAKNTGIVAVVAGAVSFLGLAVGLLAVGLGIAAIAVGRPAERQCRAEGLAADERSARVAWMLGIVALGLVAVRLLLTGWLLAGRLA